MRTLRTLLLCGFVMWSVRTYYGQARYEAWAFYPNLKECEHALATMELPARYERALCLSDMMNPNQY